MSTVTEKSIYKQRQTSFVNVHTLNLGQCFEPRAISLSHSQDLCVGWPNDDVPCTGTFIYSLYLNYHLQYCSVDRTGGGGESHLCVPVY